MGFCESNTYGRKEKSPLILYPLPKVFFIEALTTICFKNYSIIFIDIYVQPRRLKHSQFAQNREI